MLPDTTPSPSDSPSAKLLEALMQRLAVEFKFDISDEAVAEAIGIDVAKVAAFPRLTAEQEAELNRIAWQPVAETCISSVLCVLFDEAREDSAFPKTARFVDEDLAAIVNARIAAPFRAKHFGLDDARLHRAAELTAELFRDRSRFAQPTPFTQDGDRFTIHRDGDTLVVQAQ